MRKDEATSQGMMEGRLPHFVGEDLESRHSKIGSTMDAADSNNKQLPSAVEALIKFSYRGYNS